MSDASPTRYIWVLLNEHGLLPELGDRSIRGGSPAVTFDEIVERVRGLPGVPDDGRPRSTRRCTRSSGTAPRRQPGAHHPVVGIDAGRRRRGVYVAPEDVGEPPSSTRTSVALLGAWADRLVPGDAHLAARDRDARRRLHRRDDRPRPGARPAIRDRARLARRPRPHGARRPTTATPRCTSSRPSAEHGPAFRAVLEMTLEAYYRDPAVERVVADRTGFNSRRPMVGTPMAPFDEARVDRVRALPPRYRRA